MQENNGDIYKVPKWSFALIIGILLALIGAVYFNLSSQVSDLRLTMQTEFVEAKGDIRVMQAQNVDLIRSMAILTQRIQDFVDKLGAAPLIQKKHDR